MTRRRVVTLALIAVYLLVVVVLVGIGKAGGPGNPLWETLVNPRKARATQLVLIVPPIAMAMIGFSGKR